MVQVAMERFHIHHVGIKAVMVAIVLALCGCPVHQHQTEACGRTCGASGVKKVTYSTCECKDTK